MSKTTKQILIICYLEEYYDLVELARGCYLSGDKLSALGYAIEARKMENRYLNLLYAP